MTEKEAKMFWAQEFGRIVMAEFEFKHTSSYDLKILQMEDFIRNNDEKAISNSMKELLRKRTEVLNGLEELRKGIFRLLSEE